MLPTKIPRDLHIDDRVGSVRAARVFSNIVSPPVMFVVLGFSLAFQERPNWNGFGWGLGHAVLISLLPLAFISYLLRTGRISELHMSNTGERHLPYLVSLLCGLMMWGVIVVLSGPAVLRCLAIFNVVELAVLSLINLSWLISIHATAMTSTMGIFWAVFGEQTLWITIPLLVLTVAVRLYLKRHTPAQVSAGILLGGTTVLVFQWMGCF